MAGAAGRGASAPMSGASGVGDCHSCVWLILEEYCREGGIFVLGRLLRTAETGWGAVAVYGMELAHRDVDLEALDYHGSLRASAQDRGYALPSSSNNNLIDR